MITETIFVEFGRHTSKYETYITAFSGDDYEEFLKLPVEDQKEALLNSDYELDSCSLMNATDIDLIRGENYRHSEPTMKYYVGFARHSNMDEYRPFIVKAANRDYAEVYIYVQLCELALACEDDTAEWVALLSDPDDLESVQTVIDHVECTIGIGLHIDSMFECGPDYLPTCC